MPDLSFQQLLLRAGAVLLLSLVHGLILVLFSRVLGDKGPQRDGRLTVNPFQHLDVLGAASLVLFSFGWARTVHIDDMGPARRLVLVVGSLAATVLVMVLLGLAFFSVGVIFPGSATATVRAFGRTATELTAGFAALNWLPVSPLTGGLVLGAFSRKAETWVRRHQVLVSSVLVVAVASGIASSLLGPIRDAMSRYLLTVISR